MLSCKCSDVYRRFRRAWCLHHQGRRKNLKIRGNEPFGAVNFLTVWATVRFSRNNLGVSCIFQSINQSKIYGNSSLVWHSYNFVTSAFNECVLGAASQYVHHVVSLSVSVQLISLVTLTTKLTRWRRPKWTEITGTRIRMPFNEKQAGADRSMCCNVTW